MSDGLQPELLDRTERSPFRSQEDKLRRTPLRIALFYLALGLIATLFIDRALVWFGLESETGYGPSICRGACFVVVSAILVGWLVRREFHLLSQVYSLLRAVADGTTDAVFVKDRDGKYLLFNEAAARFVGKPIAEVLGKDDSALFDPQSARIVFERDRHVMTTGRAETQEETLKSAGATRTYLAAKAPYRDRHGKVIGLIGVSRDITERKRAEEELRASRAAAERNFSQLRAIVTSLADGVIVSDPQGNLLDWNPAALRMHGFENVDEVKRNVSKFTETFELSLPGGPPLPFTEWPLPKLMRGETVENYELLVRQTDIGRERIISYNGARVAGADGQPDLLVLLLHDVTERRRAEDELRASELRFRILVDHAADSILLYDDNAILVDVNEQACDSLGYSRAELIGKNPLETDSVVTPPVLAERKACLNAGETIAFETRHRRKDGTTYPAEVRIRPFSALGRRYALALSRDISDRKRVEQAMWEGEERSRLAQEAGRVGIFDWNAITSRSVWTPEQEAIYELAPGEFVGTHDDWANRLHRDDRTRVLAELDRVVFDRCESMKMEYRIVRPDGEIRWVDNRGRLRFTADGQFERLIGTTIDITEQKRAESAMRESEERYRRLMDVLPGAVFVHAGGEIVFCNPAFVRLMRAGSASELLGKSPFDIAHPDFHGLVRARMAEMDHTGQAVAGIEMRLTRCDGRTVPVYSVTAPISDRSRQAYLVVLSDLTERERSIELLRSVMDSVNDAIITFDQEGRVESANPGTERVFGYSVSELIGRDIEMLMPAAHRREHAPLPDYFRANATDVGSGREIEGARKDGSRFPVDLTVTEFQLDGERHFTGIVRDVTARKRLESQLQQSQKMEAVGRLAGGVAHDFNNLLTVINGYADMMLMDISAADRRRECIAAIRDAGERATRLTQQLLAFSRKTIVEPKVLDLNDLVADSAKLFRRLIREDIMLVFVPDPALPRIKADPGQIEQVLTNLVVNARDAMPTGGRLTIETRDVILGPGDLGASPDLAFGRYAQLSVSDTGEGMTEEVMGRIFEPFFTTKGVGKGTGLGLAVVHGVVTQCNGQVEVKSALGAGTTFSLLFPAAVSMVTKPGSPAARLESGGTETVLLVEDEGPVRDIARSALESQGYRVLDTDRGAEAIRMAREYAGIIDLLVTDVVMPEIGGRQLADSIRAIRPGLQVLYMSGYTDDSVVRHGVVEATDAFLQKPFTPLSLARKVRAVLDGVT
jgi:PAS domain S-box-containing protein